MVRLMTQKEGRLEAGDRRQGWPVQVTVQVKGDVGPRRSRPGRGRGLRSAEETGAVWPNENGVEKNVGGAVWEGTVLGPQTPLSQGSRLKSAGWGRLHPGLEKGVLGGCHHACAYTRTHAHTAGLGRKLQTFTECLLCVSISVSVITCTVSFISPHCTDENTQVTTGTAGVGRAGP